MFFHVISCNRIPTTYPFETIISNKIIASNPYFESCSNQKSFNQIPSFYKLSIQIRNNGQE